MKRTSFLPSEYRAVTGLGLLYAFRMLGLFMVLPVLALYARDLPGATPFLIGIALGIYGLTQAVLQIPFGILSDHIGRKQVIACGLLLFLVGSIVAAVANTVEGIIVGRCLQGSGAIAGALMALLADRTREEVRTPAMAAIGMSIGASFALAMVIGPLIAQWQGLSGIFWTTALLALAGLIILWRFIPPAPARQHQDVGIDFSRVGELLRRSDLLRLDFSIFCLHALLTGCFVALPLRLEALGIAPQHHGWVYLPIMAIGFFAMVPMIIAAEKYRHVRPVFIGTVTLLGLALLGMAGVNESRWALYALLFLFFTGFNLMEALLPSMISKLSPAGTRGSAMGIYSTSQFLGASAGGAAGGAALGAVGPDALFLLAAALTGVWLLSVLGMKTPRHLSSVTVALSEPTDGSYERLKRALEAVRGVEEVVIVPAERVAYLKVARQLLDEEALEKFSPAR